MLYATIIIYNALRIIRNVTNKTYHLSFVKYQFLHITLYVTRVMW